MTNQLFSDRINIYTGFIQKILLFLLAGGFLLLTTKTEAFAAQYTSEDIQDIAQGIIDWKKSDTGVTCEEPLLNNNYLLFAGTTPGDWYPIGLSRLGEKDDYEAYLAVLKDIVEQRYKEDGKLSSVKATEWHRISLAVLAAGGDPTSFGTDESGRPINLIADGTYNRGKTASLGRQGINGWIWGLITVDSMGYEIPKEAYNTRDDMIQEILRQQLADGGFAMSGEDSDVDITAMAMQALSPYYDIDKVYTYTLKRSGEEVTRTVHQVIEESINCLSKLQLDTGDYKSWGTQNVESTAQVAVSLCCLGIDIQSDHRFIKNGKTLMDGILQYRMPDGGFVHSYIYDAENPSSLPDQSNTMASEQVLYTMAAIWRQINGMRSLYDFRPEEKDGALQNDDASKAFSKEDSEAVDKLPAKLTTEQYVEVTKFLEKIKKHGISDNLDNSKKEEYIEKLTKAKKQIEEIQAEIDSINQEIMGRLYPFDKMNLGNRKTIDSIVERYEALSDYDKEKIERWEDVVKTKTKVDNLQRGLILSVLLVVAAAVTIVLFVFRIRRRKAKKKADMQKLYDKYQDED